MRPHPTLFALCFLAAAASSCGVERTIAPQPETSTSARLETLLLGSAEDPRLPSPGDEGAAATADDRALFDELRSTRSDAVRAQATNPAVFWNRLATDLGITAKQPPPLLARSYALLQVGIYDALVAGRGHRRGALPEEAVAAGVATQVLSFLFPGSLDLIQAAASDQLALAGGAGAAVRGGWSLGRAVGRLVVMRAKGDGADTPFTGSIPTGDGVWTGTNPVLPMCGSWKTWIVPSGSEIQPPPPYAFGSPEDLADVQEVLDVSLQRTPEQIAAVHKWADLPPPTIWNAMLNDRIEAVGLDLITSARAHAFLNVAMADAFICCWATKYTHWTARPFHRIPGLVTVVPTPNFPSYTSGHSTISAAAAVVLGEVFPSERSNFAEEAEEAAISRLWGGIHFRQDNEQGAAVGRLVGEAVAARMQAGRALQLAAWD